MEMIDNRMKEGEWTLQQLVEEFPNTAGVREYVIAKTLGILNKDQEEKYIDTNIREARRQRLVRKLWKGRN